MRVLKLGGSLLEQSSLCDRVEAYLRTLPTDRNLILVGGGPAVDAIRDMASLHSYDDELLHWLCIEAMDISFRLVQAQFGSRLAALKTEEQLRAWLQADFNDSALVHVGAFYTEANYRKLPLQLPLNWDTTSDSLAALLATLVDADELIVVKSCEVSPPYDWQQLAASGIVDAAFPEAIQQLRAVRIICLPADPSHRH